MNAEQWQGRFPNRPLMADFLQIGEIVNTHGVHGELKVIPLTDNPERFIGLERAWIEGTSGRTACEIENARVIKGFVLLKIAGVCRMEQAEKLKGTYISVERKDAVKLPEGSYYICDLIGLEVYDEAGGILGNLADILQTGSNDVYVVKGQDNNELLVPALKSVVLEISLEKKCITVKLPAEYK